MNPIDGIVRLYRGFFGVVEKAAEGWFVGLAARFIFLAVLFTYYFNSWSLKVGDGLAGIFRIKSSTYFVIAPWAAGGDAGWFTDLVVIAGTWAELLLPILIVIGLFARAAALGMIVFIAVQSYVDIVFHEVGTEAVGAWFDRFPDSMIMDQRAFWIFTLLVIVVKGAGAFSLDHLLARTRGREPAAARARTGEIA